MKLNEWRERWEKGEEFELPSGLVVRLRRVSLFDLMEQGEIPAPLVGLLDELVSQDRPTISVEEFVRYADVVNQVVKAAVVEPPIGDEPSEGVLGVSELPMMDRIAIFNWANSAVRRLRPFRPEEG